MRVLPLGGPDPRVLTLNALDTVCQQAQRTFLQPRPGGAHQDDGQPPRPQCAAGTAADAEDKHLALALAELDRDRRQLAPGTTQIQAPAASSGSVADDRD